jgi:hypothetical protein
MEDVRVEPRVLLCSRCGLGLALIRVVQSRVTHAVTMQGFVRFRPDQSVCLATQW